VVNGINSRCAAIPYLRSIVTFANQSPSSANPHSAFCIPTLWPPLAHLAAIRSDALSIRQLSQSREAGEVEDGQDGGDKKG
jgi:hypothetical protein